jgi:tetratricopeptide (TPR) repeat protein
MASIKQHPATRFVIAAVVIVSCSFAIRSAWRTGMGRLLATEANRTLDQAEADKAVKLSPADPQTHLSRAVALYKANDIAQAISELETRVLLRPKDYVLWLQLGHAREEARDIDGALLAMQKGIALAPHYSDPHWQYGNVLYRAGRFDEAFRELRTAAESEPTLFPVLIDLAWGTYPGNVVTVERIVAPETDSVRLSLALFLVKQNRIAEGLTLFHAATNISNDERKKLLVELLKLKQFKAAHNVWERGQPRDNESGASALLNAGFEHPVNLLDKGFGWLQEKSQERVKLLVDTKRPHSGVSSLVIEWRGESTPEIPVISQLLLVEPSTRYHLTFFARTQEIVTAAMPVVTVVDATGASHVLGQSQPLPTGTTDWQQYDATFETGTNSDAILINVQRQSCPQSPCPIFGSLWLDDFFLQK